MSSNIRVTRSVSNTAATTVAPEQPDIVQQTSVSITCVFIVDSGPGTAGPIPSARTVPFPMKIPNDLFQSDFSSDSRPLFIEAILKNCRFQVTNESMWLWQPREPLLLDTYFGKPPEKLEDLFRKLYPLEPLVDALRNTVNKREYLHFVITAEGTHQLVTDSRSDEELADLPKFPAHNRFLKAISIPEKPSSLAARSTEYCSMQSNPDMAIYDGRCIQTPPFVTIAPPIELFHPIFGIFRRQANDPGVQPTNEDLINVQEFMHAASTIYTNELDRAQQYRTLLPKILQATVHQEPNDDGTRADGVHMVDLEGVRIPLLIMVLQPELGEGGCDPSIQAGIFMRQSWIQNNRVEVLKRCCGPTLILAGSGPWLSVLGGVFTDKVIVQKLTDMVWIGHSSTHEDSRVYQIARVLTALRHCLRELTIFYNNPANLPPFQPQRFHPRFYPYPTSFIDSENHQVCQFTYIQALEDIPQCVTYHARIQGETDSPDIVVKFMARYGRDAHSLLAQEGYAPRLRYFGSLDGNDTVDDTARMEAPPGLSFCPMQMVVMDYVSVQPKHPPEDTHQQISDVLTKLHTHGFVYGDLRGPNILFDANGKVKFIDFDWSGRFDMSIRDGSLPKGLQEKIDTQAKSVGPSDSYVCYPLNLARNIWVEGVADLQPIRPQHDWGMLAKLF